MMTDVLGPEAAVRKIPFKMKWIDKINFNLTYVWNINGTIYSYLIFQLTLGLIGALTGVVSLIGLAVNANSISDLSKDQDSICTTVRIDLSWKIF